MADPNPHRSLSGGRRSHLVYLLRHGTDTVNDLALSLGLTDNAVRSHLAALEKEGLLEKRGHRAGKRRPHVVYRLTPIAERSLATTTDLVFGRLISALKTRSRPQATNELFRATGMSLTDPAWRAKIQSQGIPQRVAAAVKALRSLGGAARAERTNGRWMIQSPQCPLSAVVREHPEACKIVEGALGAIVGTEVTQCCAYSPKPQCRFQIAGAKKSNPK